MNKERRLGRGLEALLGRTLEENNDSYAGNDLAPPVAYNGPHDVPGISWVNVYEIDRNPYQPRKIFDESEIQGLAESITQHGMMQPLLVRRSGDRHQLISGERRWRAATVAGWEKVPCQVWEADDRQMTEMAIVENIQRTDLHALEKASSFQQYLAQYGCTQEELAQRIKIDRSTIANLIRLLELPEEVQSAMRGNLITPGHARALLPLGDEREQIAFCHRIQSESLSVRATEELVKSAIAQADGEPLSVVGGAEPTTPTRGRARTRSQHVASLEQELRTALGAKVEIRQGSRGRGKIVIHFTSNDEFDRLRDHIASPRYKEQRGQVG